MTKSDRLSHILQAYLEGELEVDTAVAELTHVYLVRGWRFTLVETDCAPMYRTRMRILAHGSKRPYVSPPRLLFEASGVGTRSPRRQPLHA